jgi:hypothetical protein
MELEVSHGEALELRDLSLLGLHLTLAGKCLLRIIRKRLHPTAATVTVAH